MKQSLKSQLFGTLRLENADVDVDPELIDVTEDDIEETPEGESSVAEAIDDVALDTEVNDIEEEGEDLDDAAESLEELDVAVESAVAKGQVLSKIEALALTATVRQITKKFVKDSSMVVPAIESFGNDAKGQTTLAHEGIKDAAKSFKDGAVAAAKQAYERLKEIIMNFIKRFRGVTARADKIIVAAKQIKTDINGNVKVKTDNLSVDGALDYEVIKDAANRLIGVAKQLREEYKSPEALDSIQKLTSAEQVNVIDIFKEQNAFMDKSFRKVFGEATEKDGKLVSKAFPGEYHAALVKGGAETDLHYEEFIRTTPEKKSEDGELQALQPGEIINLAGTVKALQVQVKSYDGLLKRFAEAMTRLNTAHTRNTENIKDHKEFAKEEGKDKLKAVQKSFGNAFKRQMLFYSKFVSATNSISHELLTWCEASLALANKPAGSEEKAPEDKGAEKTE